LDNQQFIGEEQKVQNYRRWLMAMVNRLTSGMKALELGVTDVYLPKSTKGGGTNPACPIRMLIHFQGSEIQRKKLDTWLEGWSLCLDEYNYLKTGCRLGGLLDVHYLSDEDIADKVGSWTKIDYIGSTAEELTPES
jgi:hypothetical protein